MRRLPDGWRLLVHEEVPSTSDLLRRLATAGEPEGLALLARRQTAGRGTSGRRWASPRGNLHLSVLLRPSEPARTLPEWSLLAALAVHDALSPHVPGPAALQLKWPNDLLLGGAKIAGLLLEAEARGDGRLDWICLGVGANLASAPDLPDRPTAALPPPAPSPELVAADVLHALSDWRRTRHVEGFGAIRRAWLDRGPAPGTHLAVTGPAGPWPAPMRASGMTVPCSSERAGVSTPSALATCRAERGGPSAAGNEPGQDRLRVHGAPRRSVARPPADRDPRRPDGAMAWSLASPARARPGHYRCHDPRPGPAHRRYTIATERTGHDIMLDGLRLLADRHPAPIFHPTTLPNILKTEPE
ncbi:biotin--[acetyl-CoA-carboxylase] ligase [Roseomonas sp. CCTCC AB2023176]|uniref:biotin--[acetyl-CoA-carboxylase] ligase n=1 Tax=Roseomonas sp. CCTCC AB2023176 TaxID=3342640 RepID=UPI0035E3919B